MAAWVDERGLLAAKPRKLVIHRRTPSSRLGSSRPSCRPSRVVQRLREERHQRDQVERRDPRLHGQPLADRPGRVVPADRRAQRRKHFVRAPLKRDMEGDFETGNVRYKARERYSFGVSDPLGIYGTAGLTASQEGPSGPLLPMTGETDVWVKLEEQRDRAIGGDPEGHGRCGVGDDRRRPQPAASTALTSSSGNVAAATATATLAGAAGQTTYLSGLLISGAGATADQRGHGHGHEPCRRHDVDHGSGAAGATVGITPLYLDFNPAPASAVNTSIVLSLPSLGAGNTNATVSAWGYRI